MRKLVVFIAVSTLLIPLSFTSLSRKGSAKTDRSAKASHKSAAFVPGHVLVRFRPDSTVADMSDGQTALLAMRARDGHEIVAQVESFGGSELVDGLRLARVPADDTLRAIKVLNARPDVEFAEPDYIWRADALPNDTQFGQQWAPKNTGQVGNNDVGCPPAQSCPQAGVVGEDIDAEQAWDQTTGSNSVVVAVLDGGVDVSHPDLQPNIWTNPGETPNDGVDNDGNGFIDDVNGWDFNHNDKTVFDGEDGDDHATHVAGIIGARGNNGQGIAGVNWQVSIMSLKVLGPSGGSTSKIIDGYNYVHMMRQRGINVRVASNSYGGPGFSQNAFLAIQQLNNAGILFVGAAGNDAGDNFKVPHYPSDYELPNIISVAATDRFGQMAVFSNFGARNVHIGAPGRGILSAVPAFFSGSGTVTDNGAKYAFFSGTSMATPHVSGAAALVLSVNPNISVQNLRGVLAFSGDVLPSLNGNTTTGRRLNAAAAVNSALQNDTTPPANPSYFRVVSVKGRNVTLEWTAPGDDGMSGTAADYDFTFLQFGGGRLILPTTIAPAAGSTTQSATVDVPYVNQNGTIELRAYDNAGNFGASTVSFFLGQNEQNDPYITATNAGPEALSTGGTSLNLNADDRYIENHPLPFAFPFYGQTRSSVTVSTNGALYFSTPPKRGNGDADDLPSDTRALQGQTMIAGLWDDLRTDRPNGGVFVVQPDANRVIFRWEGVTFGDGTPSSERPFNFEIELRNDGKIIFRYGAGQSAPINTDLFSVVGISAGEPDPYVISSHTAGTIPLALTNANIVTFTPRPSSTLPPSVQFSTAAFTVNEADRQISILVTRTGNTTGATTVDYRTIDDPAQVRCDDQINNQGAAYARCDYATSNDTLSFVPTETVKSFTIPIINDAHLEAPETFKVVLTNPSAGVSLGAATLTVTISDNDTATTPNPILQTDDAGVAFFVRQHYLDFLAREPEAGEPWSAILRGCANQFNLDPANPSAACDRITVSGSFFGSPEFLNKGIYVIVFYRVAFNRLPQYAEFAPDLRSVTGATPAETVAKRAAFANAFVLRPEFATAYGAMSNDNFVTALMTGSLGQGYNLTSINTPDPANPDGSTKVTLTIQTLKDRLNGIGGTLTRAQVLRAIVQSDEVSLNFEAVNAFVASQYYGYLRRTPDTGGFNGWVIYLRDHPGDFRTMVNGFMNSVEYRLRFGP